MPILASRAFLWFSTLLISVVGVATVARFGANQTMVFYVVGVHVAVILGIGILHEWARRA